MAWRTTGPVQDRSEPTRPIPEEGGSGYPAETARQGEIILRRPWQRRIFIGGLLALAIVLLLLSIA